MIRIKTSFSNRIRIYFFNYIDEIFTIIHQIVVELQKKKLSLNYKSIKFTDHIFEIRKSINIGITKYLKNIHYVFMYMLQT